MLPVYGLLLQHYHIKCSSVLYKMDFFDPQQETLGETHFGIKWQKGTVKSSGDAQRWQFSDVILTLFLQTAKYQCKDQRERNPTGSLIEPMENWVPLITQQTHIVGN